MDYDEEIIDEENDKYNETSEVTNNKDKNEVNEFKPVTQEEIDKLLADDQQGEQQLKPDNIEEEIINAKNDIADDETAQQDNIQPNNTPEHQQEPDVEIKEEINNQPEENIETNADN